MTEISKKGRFLLLWTAILLFDASCSFPTSSPASEFERNRTLWRSSGVVNYRMAVKIDKPGHATPNGTVEIVVRDGKTESIKRIENPTTGIDLPRWYAYDSIDDIFAFMERSINMPPEKLDVEYDSKFGFPRKLDIDPRRRSNDDELYFQVIDFERLE